MKKTVKIVMLATEKSNITLGIGSNSTKNKLHFSSIRFDKGKNNQPQHLYLISDDEIKEGDWVYDSSSLPQDAPIKRIRIIDNTHYTLYGDTSKNLKHHYKKIIATTDKSLEMPYMTNYGTQREVGGVGQVKTLPQIPESFIQAYIKAYNEGNPITEVAVEYEKYFPTTWHYNIPSLVKAHKDGFDIIKTRSDNTVIIYQSKNYSKEQVVVLCLKMQHDYPKFVKDSYYTPNMREIAKWTDKWLEDNL